MERYGIPSLSGRVAYKWQRRRCRIADMEEDQNRHNGAKFALAAGESP